MFVIDQYLNQYLISFLDLDTIISIYSTSKKYRDIINNYLEYYDLTCSGFCEEFQHFNRQQIIHSVDNMDDIRMLKWLTLVKQHVMGNNAIHIAAKYGCIPALDWLHNHGYPFNYSVDAVDYAARNGHISILEWFHHNHEFKYSGEAFLCPYTGSTTCCLNIKECENHQRSNRWFQEHGYEHRFSDCEVIRNWLRE
jgi:hypothetical protein